MAQFNGDVEKCGRGIDKIIYYLQRMNRVYVQAHAGPYNVQEFRSQAEILAYGTTMCKSIEQCQGGCALAILCT
jgi:hypothetical protein